MELIKTDIVGAQYDTFWDDISDIATGLQKKPILVIVNDFERNSVEEQQLQKMLGACKLADAQYNIVKIGNEQAAAWHKLNDQLNPAIVFLIGVSPAQLGISAVFQLNRPNHFADKIWLATLSLKELDSNADLKKDLWLGGMKPLFVDKPLPEAK